MTKALKSRWLVIAMSVLLITSSLFITSKVEAGVLTPVVKYTTDNLGINLPWLDLHNGKEEYNWLNSVYDAKLIDGDLASIQAMGVTKIRTFCQMESIFDFKNGKFVMNATNAKKLDNFLNLAEKRKISVICVMGAGNYQGPAKSLDGNFRWDLIRTQAGIRTYTTAYRAYVSRFNRHKNILMWEIHNEPYGSLTWSESAKMAGVTIPDVHNYLVQSYRAIKPLAGKAFVGFSELEEEEQSKYKLFSDSEKRKLLVDDCTDVYSLHIYRQKASQVADFTNLRTKPKWVVELGSYNYSDPKAVDHPLAANNELYNTDENYSSVVEISDKLSKSGFKLILPWGFSSNDGMVKHNSDGSHLLLKLPRWMKSQLRGA